MAKVFIIVFDSLRKDVFDSCSHPLLEEWRKKGTVFERCFSQSGFTPISFASILSGLFPSRNSVKCTNATVFKFGKRPRHMGPVYWNVVEQGQGNLLIRGSEPLQRSAFSRFENRLLTLRYSKTNAFPELNEDEMMPSPEFGQDLSRFYDRCYKTGKSGDFLSVIRVYDTHLPYGRGISPCDAESSRKIKKKVSATFAIDNGCTLLRKVALPALQRALDYLSELWRLFKDSTDFFAVMSDHGDNWSDDPDDVGHGRFLTGSVLHVPLLIVDNQHTGRCYRYCNNSDVIPTMLKQTGKTAEWNPHYMLLPIDEETNDRVFASEANAMDGRFLRTTIDEK